MLVRLRSKDGNFRVEVPDGADFSVLVDKILETSPDADPTTITISNQPRGNEVLISTLKGRSVQGLGIKQGDMVFVGYQPRAASSTSSTIVQTRPPTATQNGAALEAAKRPWESAQEDAVDAYWRSQTGMIPRSRDPLFCKHAANGMCDHCMPLEPYDSAYQAEHNIKHLSYHAYLRKISPKSSSAATSAIPPLDPPSYKVKVPCPNGNHPPWPGGICTGCQPSAITLQPQPFRMVDHLEIASMDIVDRFLQAWRRTGLQRFGWLIGHYQPYDKVPMGVKAVVEAIHEPPQEGELDGLSLGIPWEEEPRIRELAKSASTPLTIVGYIFSDLDPTPDDRTKNVYKRHQDSFFLSSLEAIFAATLQKQNPTPSRSSPTGFFSSRLVTAVLTATEDGQVDVSAYQVSEQATAMVEADMIEASVEPGTVRVKEEDRSQDSARYVPDVFYRYKNEYGREVKKSAKPCFPVEYLIVNVTHGFPQNPSPLFRSSKFSIENRLGLEEQRVQDILGALSQMRAPEATSNTLVKAELAKWLSDWHLVSFLGTTQLLSVDDMKLLVRIVTSPTLLDDPSQLDTFLATEGWQTLLTFAAEHSPARPTTSAPSGPSSGMDEDIPQDVFDQIAAAEAAARSDGVSGSGGRGVRICPHCTFENAGSGSDCDVCGLPLEG